MRNRAFIILFTVMLGLTGVSSPVFCAYAQDREEQGTQEQKPQEQGNGIGQELYQKVDEALGGVDKESLRRQIREALHQMDEMGISPTSIAEEYLGIRDNTAEGFKMPGNTLIEEAQRTVRKSTEGFFTVLWNGFLDTLGGIIGTGFSIFSDKGGSL